MSIGEDQTECPLCMEPLEMDDINFFPCTCGYQICRFCWHRIRTDENDLCPACRKSYPEDPAEFKPLTEDELQRIKKERRQKEAQRKQKAAENRKHLANVRVVQKNLVFVVGLSQRLADPDVLKKHEYFGKFGRIHKVVINQSTSYAGAQVSGPSASAYVTYHRPEDALKAIQAVNNIHVDGRTLKASLGTTKYCSHFLRGAQCPKPDCMYLHELGEEAASFTKEEMQQGKHQEYEQKLCEQFLNNHNLVPTSVIPPVPTKQPSRKKTSSPALSGSPTEDSLPLQTTKEAWPSLIPNTSTSKPVSQMSGFINGSHSQDLESQNRAPGFHRNNGQHPDTITNSSNPKASSPDLSPSSSSSSSNGDTISPNSSTNQQHFNNRSTLHSLSLSQQNTSHQPSTGVPFSARSSAAMTPPGLVSSTMTSVLQRKLPFQTASDSMSLFSSANGFPMNRNPKPAQHSLHHPDDSLTASPEIPDTIPVSSSTDWQAAFGFSSSLVDSHDDDLGFDPWNESAKALAEIIENESSTNHHGFGKLPYGAPTLMNQHNSQSMLSHHPVPIPPLMSNLQQMSHMSDNRQKNSPPGFSHMTGGMHPNHHVGPQHSKIMNLMQFGSVPPHLQNNSSHPQNSFHHMGQNNVHSHGAKRDTISPQDWQDGLRALLPNINISFGAPPASSSLMNDDRLPLGNERLLTQRIPQQNSQKYWCSDNQEEVIVDPAIVTSGSISDHHNDEIPHWMASLHHLTEDTHIPNTSNHSNIQQQPLLHQMSSFGNSSPVWPPQAPANSLPVHPPPGFHNAQIRGHHQQGPAELTQLADGFQ